VLLSHPDGTAGYRLVPRARESRVTRSRAGLGEDRLEVILDGELYLTLDLEFDTAGQAEAFAGFLHTHVWSSAASAPALVGAPHTRILEFRR